MFVSMHRKHLSALLVLVMLISMLAGCGKEPAKVQSNNESSSTVSEDIQSNNSDSTLSTASGSNVQSVGSKTSATSKNSSAVYSKPPAIGTVSEALIKKTNFTKLSLSAQKLSSGLSIPTKSSLQLKNTKVRFLKSGGGTDFDKGGVYYEALNRFYGIQIDSIYVPADQVTTRLTQMVNSNDSPDVLDIGNTYPGLPISGLVQPVDDAIDYSFSLLSNVKDSYDQFYYKGYHYALPAYSYSTSAVFYNKQIFEDNDMETPLQLLKKGKWDWNTFRDAAKALTIVDKTTNKTTRYGVFLANWQSSRLVFTTGENFIKQTNGKFVNNLDNSGYSRAYQFLFDLVYNLKVASPNRDISATHTSFDNGKAAMIMTAGWMGTNPINFPKLKTQGILEYVPYPKDPQSSAHIVPGTPIAYYVAAGSKNLDTARAFVYAISAAYQEANIPGTETYQDLYEKNKKAIPNMSADYFRYLATQYREDNSMRMVLDNYQAVVDVDAVYSLMAGGGSAKQQTYKQAVGTLVPVVNTAIDSFNKK